jgi:hypothetical protein
VAEQSRALKLSFLGDISDLAKKIGMGEKEVASFGDKVADFGKKAAVAFAAAAAAAAAYASKLAIEGVKAAIEDEKAQTALRVTLENVTGATNDQIAATERYIAKTSLAIGVTDDELRPSLDRLARATGSVEKAQQLQTLALDIAAGTGRSLQSVSEGLSKAYEGNTSALTRLGVGITSAEIKTLSFDQITAKLAGTFGGQATVQAETFSGRMERLQIAFDEAKETVGFALLPILEKLITFITSTILPAVNKFSNSFGAEGLSGVIENIVTVVRTVLQPVFEGLVNFFGKVRKAINDNRESFEKFADLIQDYIAPVLGKVLGGALKGLGTIASGVINIISGVVDLVTGAVEGAIKGINALIRAYNAIPILPNIGTINVPNLGGPSNTGSNSVNVASLPSGVTTTVPKPNATAQPAVVNNITVNGAIDSESTARQIAQVLTESAARGTGGGGGAFNGLLVT